MHIMNFAYQRSVGPLIIYYTAAVLLIVNGQSTPDDEIGRAEISELRDRMAMLERQLRSICQTTDASKLGTLRFEQHALFLLRTFFSLLAFCFQVTAMAISQSLLADNHNTPDRHFTARRYAQARSLLSSCVCPSVCPSRWWSSNFLFRPVAPSL